MKLLVGTCLFLLSATTHAFIVDTGPGPASTAGFVVGDFQYLGGQFTTDQTWTITSVESWVVNIDSAPIMTTGTIAIYTDDTNLPSTELFSTKFNSMGGSPEASQWEGAFSLSWLLNSGTYWITIESRVDEGDDFNGRASNPVPNPLAVYAGLLDADTCAPSCEWTPNPGMNIGFRIDATAAPVPLPAAFWFMLGGLALLGRKIKRS